MKTFWQDLPKPFFVLAPMDDVTDSVFRQIVAETGKPDVFFTEFTNTDGMCSAGRSRVEKKLQFTENERPLIAQIWGTNPEHYKITTEIVRDMGFTGVDINMGCPEKSIVKRGSCAALIKNPSLASEIIKSVQSIAGDMPVSVKTRIGFNEITTEEWATFLLEHNLDALTIHGRTAKEESKVDAHWDEIGKVVKLRDKLKKHTTIIGNGDIKTKKEGHEKVEQYNLDGIMIGRGIFQNAWLFDEQFQATTTDRLEMLINHAKLFEETWGKTKQFAIMRKFVKTYVHSFPEATELRIRLMGTNNFTELEKTVTSYLENSSKS
jgi:nifR3 family TIM-barrel protein